MVSIGLPALAHAQLIDASPQANQVLTTSPSEFKLNFSDTLIDLGPNSHWLKVENSAGQIVSSDASLEGSLLTAVPLQALKPGKYQLSWRVLSEDGHPVQGSYQFTISGKKLALEKRNFDQRSVTLEFNQVLASGTKVTVLAAGSKAQRGTLRVSDRQASFRFAAKPASGRYVVHYVAKSVSGLTIRGSFPITVR